MKKNYTVILLIIFTFINNAYSDEVFQKEVVIDRSLIISSVETYLNNIQDLVADFTQIDPSGTEVNGKFFLSRPGKLRWQYNPPSPILIVVNNALLTHYDYDLDQISHISAEDNLASFLTRKIINFSNDISIINIERAKDIIRITLAKKNKEEEGELTLIFSEKPLELKKIELIDSMNQITTISLYNVKKDVKLNKELFIIKNPKYFKNERY